VGWVTSWNTVLYTHKYYHLPSQRHMLCVLLYLNFIWVNLIF
jgi:hypothetical protein